jgi:rhodanese-related sulfurtransferase
MKKIIALTIASLVAFAVYAAEYKDITIKELKSDISSQKVTLLDANGTQSWEKGHIPGAINFFAKQDYLGTILPRDKGALIVAYCAGPKCKAYQAAAKAAEKLGYTNIRHLSAGIEGWKDAGEKMEARK